MTVLHRLIKVKEAAASFVCHRNVDFMVDVHVVGKLRDSRGVPIPQVGVFLWNGGRLPKDGRAEVIPFAGESRGDGSLDIKFKYMWGERIRLRQFEERMQTSFAFHFVHDEFQIAVMDVAVTVDTPRVACEAGMTLERLSEEQAIVIKKKGSRSQYLRKQGNPKDGDPGESWDTDQPWPHEAPFGGDTFSIAGNCGDQTQRIVDGVRWGYWQLRNGNIVTDPGLRVCIMQHMNNASLGCGGGGCSGAINGYNDDYLLFRSSYIVVCLNKVRNLSITDIGRLAIHEWAHSCGWDHGDGKGVPGDSGYGLA